MYYNQVSLETPFGLGLESSSVQGIPTTAAATLLKFKVTKK